jgi:hypothetical protein
MSIQEPYVHKEVSVSIPCADKPANPRIPSRFASWDRRNLENLAEELVAELNETKEELRAALKHWRKAVKDSTK